MRVNKPNFILHVVSNWSEAAEKRWQEMATQYGTIHAYHGSKLENFHSILRHGLQQHLHKVIITLSKCYFFFFFFLLIKRVPQNGLFGSGIYLSSELGVSLPYSLNGCSWPLSKLGDQMSCVALCEAIDHPDVKCQQPGGYFIVCQFNDCVFIDWCI
jgi:poly[ADP-ribose] polymerase 16